MYCDLTGGVSFRLRRGDVGVSEDKDWNGAFASVSWLSTRLFPEQDAVVA